MKVAKSPKTQIQQNKVSEAVESSSYTKAIKCIRAAIDELGKDAKDYILAQESIANLGVVLLDLNK